MVTECGKGLSDPYECYSSGSDVEIGGVNAVHPFNKLHTYAIIHCILINK